MSRPATAPRDYTRGAAMGDRHAAIAARRSFVALKLTFADAAAALEGHQAHWLRQQVRAAEQPVDLWLLRAPLFSALAGASPERRRMRQRLRRALEAVFAEPQPTTAFAAAF
ncbi:MAG: hypothetical protein KIT17_16505 [Rubrivivax sp.]|nr:hypothetical protein [Rubrivivax sp.]